jgi:hypothetical protein
MTKMHYAIYFGMGVAYVHLRWLNRYVGVIDMDFEAGF